MIPNLIIPEESSKEERYQLIIPSAKALLSGEEHLLSHLSNFISLLYFSFHPISWVGFYFDSGRDLYLGPFHGKVACTRIEYGRGVCGKAFETGETVIVPNVLEFEDHIACDAGSRSEIVVPLIDGDKKYGVLDIDSYDFETFDETDEKYLKELVALLFPVFETAERTIFGGLK
jgi:GAF domain-containing protein